MSLRTRKIKKYLAEKNEACASELNSSLGTSFAVEYDGSSIPDDIDGWNWDEDETKRCFYHAYYAPLEQGFAELFKDEMYKEAVIEQVKTIRFETGRSVVDYEFEGETLKVKHKLCVNYRDDPGGRMVGDAAKSLFNTIEGSLS